MNKNKNHDYDENIDAQKLVSNPLSDSKTKLLIVADTFYPKVDGTLKFIEEFIKRSYKKFSLSLLVPHVNNSRTDNELINPLKKYVEQTTALSLYSNIGLSGYNSVKLNYTNISKIKSAVKRSDIIFVQGPAGISYLTLRYARRYNKKIIFFPHVLSWELIEKFAPPNVNKYLHNAVKKAWINYFNKCSALFVPYEELKLKLEENGVNTKMHVTQLGVDIEQFSPAENKSEYKDKLNIPRERKVIGYVGRISREKNVEILVRAFEKLKRKHTLHLLIVGDGSAKDKATINKIKNNTVTGFVNNVEDYLKAMDIFVMPSLTETTSLATLEAMSCGISVITSKVGFIKDYVVKNHNGIFFSKNSASMLALKIEKLLKDQEFAQMIGINARNTIVEQFSWDTSIRRMVSILHDYE